MPQDKDAVVEAIAAIGRHQRERERIQAAMNDTLAEVRQGFETQAAPHAEAIKGLSAGVQTWCEANRDRLTQEGKVKTARLASGEIRWRTRPPSVSVQAVETVAGGAQRGFSSRASSAPRRKSTRRPSSPSPRRSATSRASPSTRRRTSSSSPSRPSWRKCYESSARPFTGVSIKASPSIVPPMPV
ncbi:MAG: host-nuclease inhibitor Gam family protein [Chromatiales bacterium]|nr:host-nuclease inhibitor Gam family protein [Chromatiales bacterium]